VLEGMGSSGEEYYTFDTGIEKLQEKARLVTIIIQNV
jgi:hypothetical protein